MKAVPLSRAAWLAFGLTVAGAAGFGILASRAPQPALPQVAEVPACTSCDARHARLADLRAQMTGKTE